MTRWWGGRGAFTCPTCGSQFFRTDLPSGRGQCKGRSFVGPDGGHGYTGCTFTWDRQTQDEAVFEAYEEPTLIGKIDARRRRVPGVRPHD